MCCSPASGDVKGTLKVHVYKKRQSFHYKCHPRLALGLHLIGWASFLMFSKCDSLNRQCLLCSSSWGPSSLIFPSVPYSRVFGADLHSLWHQNSARELLQTYGQGSEVSKLVQPWIAVWPWASHFIFLDLIISFFGKEGSKCISKISSRSKT